MAELHLNGDSSGFLEIQPPENGPNRILVAPSTQGSGLNTFRISEADNDLLIWDTAVSELNIGSGLSGGFITYSGSIELLPATLTDLGGVIPVGDNFTIAPSGNLNLTPTTVVSGSYTSASIRVDEYGRIYEAEDGPSGIIRTITVSQQITGGGSTDVVNIGHANSGATAGSYSFPTLTVDDQGHITDAESNTAVQFVGAGTGLVTVGSANPITESGQINLADTAVTPGTYDFATVTVDQQGRLTAVSSGTIPTPPPTPGASGTVEVINTAVGIQGGPITDSGTLTLTNTAVTPGTYNFATITVDQQGRLTAASTGTIPPPPPQTSGTVEVINTAVGIQGGPITESGTVSLTNTGVTAGSYNFANITVDAQGRLTAASTGIPPSGATGTVNTVNTAVGIQGGPITTSGTVSLTNTGVTAGTYEFATITVDAQGRITTASTNEAGTVTQINTNNGIQGGPITDTGTIGLTTTGVTPGTYNFATITVDARGRISAASTGTPGGGGTVTQVNTTGGIQGGPITTTGTVSLTNTGVSPGSYTSANITVDANGRLTAASNGGGGGGVSDITAGDGLTGGGTGSVTIAVDGTVVRTTGNQSIGGTKTFTSNIVGNLTGNATNIAPGQTNALNLQAGTNAQRPGSPANGNLRYNTSNNTVGRRLEVYDSTDSAWRQLEFISTQFTFPNFTASAGQRLPSVIVCNNCTIGVNVVVDGSTTIFAQGDVNITGTINGAGRGPFGSPQVGPGVPGGGVVYNGRGGQGMGGSTGENIANPISLGLGSQSGGGGSGPVGNYNAVGTVASILTAPGGDGGASFFVRALGDISITGGGIDMGGSNGGFSGAPAGTLVAGAGGGGGGIICIDGDGSVSINASLDVGGGDGGNGSSNGTPVSANGGGGGGGGAILLISRSNNLSSSGGRNVSGGSAGTPQSGTNIGGAGGGSCYGQGGFGSTAAGNGILLTNASLFP